MKHIILHLMDFFAGLLAGKEAYERNKEITRKLLQP